MSESEQSRLGAVGGSRGVLLGLFFVALFGTATQIVPASVLTLVMSDLRIGPSAAGWIVSATLLAEALLCLPIGFGLDRFDNRHIVLSGTVVIVAGNLWSWTAAVNGTFLQLVASRFVTGIGLAILWTSGANIVGSTFTGRNAATATGIFTASAPLGYVVAQFTGPVVAEYTRWETNFLLYAAASTTAFLLFAILAYRTADVRVEKEKATLGDFGRVFRDRTVWLIALMSFVGYSLNLVFNSWMPTYLTTKFGFELTKSGLLIGLFPLMGVFARASGGAISDHLLDGRRRPVPILSFVVTIPIIVVMLVAETSVVIALLLVLSGYFVQLGIGLFYTLVQELVSENVSGSAIAVLSTMSFIGGFSGPIVAGVLIEQTGTYLAAFGFAFGLAVLGVAFAMAAPEPNHQG